MAGFNQFNGGFGGGQNFMPQNYGGNMNIGQAWHNTQQGIGQPPFGQGFMQNPFSYQFGMGGMQNMFGGFGGWGQPQQSPWGQMFGSQYYGGFPQPQPQQDIPYTGSGQDNENPLLHMQQSGPYVGPEAHGFPSYAKQTGQQQANPLPYFKTGGALPSIGQQSLLGGRTLLGAPSIPTQAQFDAMSLDERNALGNRLMPKNTGGQVTQSMNKGASYLGGLLYDQSKNA